MKEETKIACTLWADAETNYRTTLSAWLIQAITEATAQREDKSTTRFTFSKQFANGYWYDTNIQTNFGPKLTITGFKLSEKYGVLLFIAETPNGCPYLKLEEFMGMVDPYQFYLLVELAQRIEQDKGYWHKKPKKEVA